MINLRHLVRTALPTVLLLLFSGNLMAHKASDSFIYVDQNRSEIRIDVALRDLALVLPLDRNGDQKLSGSELRAGRDQITRWTEQGVTLSNPSGTCRMAGQQWGLVSLETGEFSTLGVLGPDKRSFSLTAEKTWKLAFGFGLIHGFGFASVLGDLTSGVSQTVLALAGFNIGVELGQLGLLLVLFPLLYLWGKTNHYRRAVVPVMLVAIGVVSLYWVAERTMVI